MSTSPTAETAPTRVWDLPTRLFHWLLALTILGSIITGHVGVLEWHMRLGYLAFGLVAFRLLWGFFGGRWSRFASFAYSPGTVLRYLRGQSRDDEYVEVGHNPLGSFSVFVMLALLMVQVGTGLLADDEIATTGPLNRFVSNATANSATAWHKDIGQWLLIVLIVLHIGAVLYYLLKKKRDLVRPMIHGDKALPAGTPPAADTLATRLLALALGAGCAVLVGWIVSLGG